MSDITLQDPYGPNDPGADFDAGETARAKAYVLHMIAIGEKRLEALNKLQGNPQAFFDLVHRMRPITRTAPTPYDSPATTGLT